MYLKFCSDFDLNFYYQSFFHKRNSLKVIKFFIRNSRNFNPIYYIYFIYSTIVLPPFCTFNKFILPWNKLNNVERGWEGEREIKKGRRYEALEGINNRRGVFKGKKKKRREKRCQRHQKLKYKSILFSYLSLTCSLTYIHTYTNCE